MSSTLDFWRGLAQWLFCFTPFTQSRAHSFLCGTKIKLNMHSHTQPAHFNMEPCRLCGEKRLPHKQTDAEKQTDNKTESNSQADLWHPKNRPTHIKTQNHPCICYHDGTGGGIRTLAAMETSPAKPPFFINYLHADESRMNVLLKPFEYKE